MARLSRLALIAVFSVAAVALPDVSHSANSTYVVQNGDTLFGIAARLDVRLSELLRANNLTATSVIQPGQQLTVPGGTVSAPAASGGATYTVREGDWLRPHRRPPRHHPRRPPRRQQPDRHQPDPTRTTTHDPRRKRHPNPDTIQRRHHLHRESRRLAGRIADRHGITLSALLAANNLTATSLIQPGQQLTIPGGNATPTPTPSSGGTTYTVKAGDWLARIADRHGITLSALLAANNLTATSLIQPGQRLTIPGGTTRPDAVPPPADRRTRSRRATR